jgi:predicted transcriptional regulator
MKNTNLDKTAQILIFKIVDLMVQGKTKSDIAKKLSISRTTLYKFLKSKEYVKEFDLYVKNLHRDLKSNYIKTLNNSLSVINNFLNSNIKVGDKVKIAIGVLKSFNLNIEV